jgi:hypothetical protein
VVERLVAERERERISLGQSRLDPRPPQVASGELELSRLDVDAGESKARELLPEDGEYRADSAADLEQARPGVEPGAVADQAVSPVLCLLDEPLLLAGSVTMNVLGYAARLRTGRDAASTCLSRWRNACRAHYRPVRIAASPARSGSVRRGSSCQIHHSYGGVCG